MKLKKHTPHLLILFVLFLLLGAGLLYFFLVHRCRESLQFLVNRESKGSYVFDAGEAQLSVWHKTIVLKESILYNRDSANTGLSYRIKIHELYFSLASWKQLLFHKKIIADSVSIGEPVIEVHVYKTTEHKEKADFKPADLLTYLEKTLAHFNVHSFSLKEADFTFQGVSGSLPLHVGHINLTIADFTGVNNEDSHLLGSDKVAILLGPQHWTLPDGRHEIHFNRLSFDSKGQRFELDSFRFYQKAGMGQGEVKLAADKFFFTSRHLPAIYQKGELLLDTLICIGPVLTTVNPMLTTLNKGKEEKTKDSLTRIRITDNLFKWINVKFVAVIDGVLSLQKDGRTENTTTRKANVSIFNLSLDPAATPSISTDSIRIDLKKLEFITKDSMFRLAIDEFSIRQQDVLFRNVTFGPTSYNHSDKGGTFTAPSLLLKDISITDLLQKRLTASGAELYRPSIIINEGAGSGPGTNGGNTVGTITRNLGGSNTSLPFGKKSSARKMALFYRTLHGMSELIDAPQFNITEGTISYQAGGPKALGVTVKGFDAHILLNQIFASDSLVDITHAIPDLRIAEFNLASKGIRLHALGYRLDGKRRSSRVDQLEISTDNGLAIKGNGFYWNMLDWDIYQRTLDIQLDSLHADALAIHVDRLKTGPRQSDSSKNLPVIRIGRLHVGKIELDKGGNNGEAAQKGSYHFNIQDLQAEDIRSANRFFTWGHVSLDGSDIALGDKLRIGNIAFDTKEATILKGLQFGPEGPQGPVGLSIPVIRMKVDWHSSDLSRLSIPSFIMDQATLHYLKVTGRDSLAVNATLRLQAKNMLLFKDSGKWEPHAEVEMDWKDAGLRYVRDSMVFWAQHLAGSFEDKEFLAAMPMKTGWQQLMMKARVTAGDLHYTGKNLSADAARISWNPSAAVLNLTRFRLMPRLSQEETFKKARWQMDYISVKGESLTMTGLQPGRRAGDSLIRLHQLILDGVTIDASRDKNIPFRHGIEKPMPTKLISTLPLPIRIDSVLLLHSSVVYHELSASTHEWSHIPFEELNGAIVDVSTRPHERDTLKIMASARLFTNKIRGFNYAESYGDPLSGFSVSNHLSAMDLTGFSQVSVPMAYISIMSGRADTLYSDWKGNMYAATGTMHFFYSHLKVRVLDKEDIKKRNFLPIVETWAANLVLPNERKKASAIFVERDREKFVFNYWVKALSSGAISTVGIKTSKSYQEKYLKKYQEYSLPAKSMEQWK